MVAPPPTGGTGLPCHGTEEPYNAEVKLCNLYQLAEAFSGIASCKNN